MVGVMCSWRSHLADSNCYRWFCRLGIGDTAPDHSTLQKAIKRVRAETWETSIARSHSPSSSASSGANRFATDCTSSSRTFIIPQTRHCCFDCVRVHGSLDECCARKFCNPLCRPHSPRQTTGAWNSQRQDRTQPECVFIGTCSR